MLIDQFSDSGYEAGYVKAFDNFPLTKHTECIALVERKVL